MTPYELRFEIFKQAYNYACDEFHSSFAATEQWNGNPKNSVMIEYPSFPTYEYVEKLADKINCFVSSK